ncbi:hypothetical protein VNO78_20861 [Psophocarpus tetragonolobus]|uniref:Senescence regulator n=1 Tax=Psophocarpus tetragonolobus TaxID=3891 RepID=A0AAN9XH48_PSOTE
MASRKNLVSKASRYIFPTTSEESHLRQSEESGLEMEEAEIWNYQQSSGATDQSKKGLPSRSVVKRGSRSKVEGGGVRVTPASLPVNIPDWSKILKEDYKEQPKWESDDEEDDEDEHHQGLRIRLPPHEYLARTRGASLSVHEGVGRTLKGRDLRSVRNAIWKKVGFED